jgi:ZIP family zinc transporter
MLWQALAYAAVPAVAAIGAGLIAEFTKASSRTVSLALHAAAGMLLAVISLGILAPALRSPSLWLIVLAFLGGSVLLLAIDAGLSLAKNIGAGGGGRAATIYAGVFVDLLSDGASIGTGVVSGRELGLLLALGLFVADGTEGFATMSTVNGKGPGRTIRLALIVALALAIPLGALLSVWLLGGASHLAQQIVLAVGAREVLTLVVKSMIPEAHANESPKLSALLLVAGFALFVLITGHVRGPGGG